MLAKSLARSVDCSFSRLQFTPDLLPSDVTGVNVFNQRSNEFEFRPGPVFANILLVDEINRASPKTQAALLECMQEYQVTVDGVTYQLRRRSWSWRRRTRSSTRARTRSPRPSSTASRCGSRSATRPSPTRRGCSPRRRRARRSTRSMPSPTAEEVLAAIDERANDLRRGQPQPLRRRGAPPHPLGLAALPGREPARRPRAPARRQGAGARRDGATSSSPTTSSWSPARPRAPADPLSGGALGAGWSAEDASRVRETSIAADARPASETLRARASDRI